MPSRPRQSYSDLREQLENAQWLLQLTRQRLEALEAHAPTDRELLEAIDRMQAGGAPVAGLLAISRRIRESEKK